MAKSIYSLRMLEHGRTEECSAHGKKKFMKVALDYIEKYADRGFTDAAKDELKSIMKKGKTTKRRLNAGWCDMVFNVE